MGLRGPPKKPTDIKLLQGIPGGKGNLNPDEPKPPRANGPKAPAGMNKYQRKLWREACAKLAAMRVLTVADLKAIERYCDLYEKFSTAKAFLDEKGFYYAIFHDQTPAEAAAGVPKKLKYMAQFPQVNIYMQLAKELTRIEGQFGMTPASRANLSMEAPGGLSPKDAIRDRLYRKALKSGS